MALNFIVKAIERFKQLVEQHYKETVNGQFDFEDCTKEVLLEWRRMRTFHVILKVSHMQISGGVFWSLAESATFWCIFRCETMGKGEFFRVENRTLNSGCEWVTSRASCTRKLLAYEYSFCKKALFSRFETFESLNFETVQNVKIGSQRRDWCDLINIADKCSIQV